MFFTNNESWYLSSPQCLGGDIAEKKINVEEYDLKQVALLRQKVHAAMEEGLRRYRTYPLPLNVY